MLIDLSYFTGSLSIANLSKPDIQAAVTDVIVRNEEDFLTKALGYDFYSSFINGLALDPVPERWLKILQGTTYINANGYTRRWVGLANANAVTYISNQTRDTEFHYAGETENPNNGNPVTFAIGDNKLIDASLNNWNYSVDIRGTGELNPDTERQPIGGGGVEVTIPGYATQEDELWILRFFGRTINIAAAGEVKISPIANYAWWHYVREISMQLGGVGTVKASAENAQPAYAGYKQAPVWNDMVDMLAVLWDYLYQNESAYKDDGYVYSEIDRNYFRKQNVFNM